MDSFKIVFKIVVISSLAALAGNACAQSSVPDQVIVQKADFRDKRPQSAIVAALSASRQDVVVVLVRGGSQELIDETEGHMKALAWNGCDRVALILSDLLPDESSAVIAIFSSGQTYAVMQDAATSVQTGSDFYKLVRDAYEEDIRPKIKATVSPPSTGGF